MTSSSNNKFQRAVIPLLSFSTLFFFLATLVLILQLPSQRLSSLTNRIYPQADFVDEKTKILQLIEDNYIGDYPSDTKIAESQLKGLVASLDDPFSEYLPKAENEKFQNDLNKRYEGVGISFRQSAGQIIAQRILPNSPALAAGVENGDVLLKVDDQEILGLTLVEVAQKIRGPKDTQVNLEFDRQGESITFQITRQSLAAELIMLDTKPLQTGGEGAIITISSFGEGLDTQMMKLVKQIRDNNNIEKIILDLRSNTGGLLKESIAVASYFLESGEVVVQEKSKGGVKNDKSLEKEVNLRSYPVVVLVDQYSASASEIVAGAVRDQKGGILIGQKTFGKGVVQKLYTLNDGNILKLTVAEWLTPNGNNINKTGLEPDIKLSPQEDALEVALKGDY
ncbi:MAG: S41 family peptidase [Patescibacteria group bacterium]